MKKAMVLAALLAVAACEGKETPKVEPLQRKDKNLNCKQVQLEINEAEFYRSTAEKNKNPSMDTLLMPIGYISTYMNANDAATAANARIEYLNRVYDILKCDEDENAPSAAYQAPSGSRSSSGAEGSSW